MTIATLDELSTGRIILGLGSGFRSYVEEQGIRFKKPLTTMREYVDIIRLILTGEFVEYKGRIYTLKGTRLIFKPFRKKIPIYIAARGPKMFQLAGEIADGVLASDGFCANNYVKWALRNVSVGAEKAGKDPANVDLASIVFLSVSNDHHEARENVKPAVVSMLARGTLNTHLQTLGVREDDLTPTRYELEHGNFKDACEKVPDVLLDASAIYGTPQECAIKMKEFRGAGVSLPIIQPIGPDKEWIIRLAKDW